MYIVPSPPTFITFYIHFFIITRYSLHALLLAEQRGVCREVHTHERVDAGVRCNVKDDDDDQARKEPDPTARGQIPIAYIKYK